jgi:molybdopterin molybdotransferase
MLRFDDAVAALHALPMVGKEERVPLQDADARVLAQDLHLDRDVPGFDRATMDGYAVALDGERTTFEVIGVIHAGEDKAHRPAAGQAVRIMTGAPCPPGVTIVPVEVTTAGQETVTIDDPTALVPGRHIAWQGEDGREGDVVARAGQRMNPFMLAAIAMAGHEQVPVYRRPRVSVVTTGDEVGGAGRAGIRDSNGPLLATLLTAFGCAVTREHAPDDADALDEALARARSRADVVVTVGGVSAGAKDLVPGCAEALGYTQVFHKVAMQPGKPVLVCSHPDGGHLVGLPGNPVSVIATTHLILGPVLGRYLGGWEPNWVTLPLAEPFSHPGSRHLFLPAAIGPGGVTPIRWNGSGDLLAAAAGEGLLDARPGLDLAAGSPVRFLPYVGVRLGDRGLLPARERGARP